MKISQQSSIISLHDDHTIPVPTSLKLQNSEQDIDSYNPMIVQAILISTGILTGGAIGVLYVPSLGLIGGSLTGAAGLQSMYSLFYSVKDAIYSYQENNRLVKAIPASKRAD